MSDEPFFDDDIEYADQSCPKCGGYDVVRRDCTAIHCDEGYVDEHETDAINYAPGEYVKLRRSELPECDECRGYGCHIWCRTCGWDVLEQRFLSKKCEDEFSAREEEVRQK